MSEISIIIPVYNAEKDISRCIDSIIAQSFFSFDLILVNDGSTDKSPLIIEEYAQRDNRIRTIHQKNSGPSKARNVGIEFALNNCNCQYITFVDSDDCIHPRYLEYMRAAMQKENLDVSMCRHSYITDQKNKVVEFFDDNCSSRVMTAEELMVQESSAFNYIWGKMYAAKCFTNVRYPEDVSFGEDNLIIFKIMFEAGKIAYIDNMLYYYYYTPTGITKSSWNTNSLDVFRGIEAQLDYYKEHGYQKAYNKEVELYIQQCAYQIHRIVDNKENFHHNKEYMVRLKKMMINMLVAHPEYSLYKNYYWLESIHPYQAKTISLLGRLKRAIRKVL